jgi:monoamine oxidase
VIGGGVAGLSAAHSLSSNGVSVTLLEARNRFGGRILTLHEKGLPLDLGAEFIHGRHPDLWKLIGSATLAAEAVPDRQLRLEEDGSLRPHDFWSEISKVLGQIDLNKPDESFATFITHAEASPGLKKQSFDFVEGFNAARADKISAHSVAVAEKTSEELDGDKQFRLRNGYGSLVHWLQTLAHNQGCTLRLGCEVTTIKWKPGEVEATFKHQGKTESLLANAAIVTLPLGVLQAGTVQFDPPLPSRQQTAISNLAFGSVMKITMVFQERFWPGDFGFVHSLDNPIPTWWSDARGNVLTGWAGGPSAEQFESLDPTELEDCAVKTLARIFGESPKRIRGALEASYVHNWSKDPFARGAYSYVPVGAMSGPEWLAEPVEATLFFAGEATAQGGQVGTVHGALESGMRAARELIAK